MIGSSVTDIGFDTFAFCGSLMAITVNPDNSAYSSVDGILFNKNQSEIARYPQAKAGSYIIPPSVATIGRGAFSYCLGVTKLTIPQTVTTIKDRAFEGCRSLTKLTIPNSVTTMGDYTFAGCSSLTSIAIGTGITRIGTLHSFIAASSPTSPFPTASPASEIVPSTTATNWWQSISAAMPRPMVLMCSLIPRRQFITCRELLVGQALLPGRPTALWFLSKPIILGCGLHNNRFGFTISWATNTAVAVEACTDLANGMWLPVSTNILTSGSSYFSDPQWTNHPARSYRLRSP